MAQLFLDSNNAWSDPASTSLKYLRQDNTWATADSDHKFLDGTGNWSVPELNIFDWYNGPGDTPSAEIPWETAPSDLSWANTFHWEQVDWASIDYYAMFASKLAMDAIVASSTAMEAVAASSTAMTKVAASSTAMQAIASSGAALAAICKSKTAADAVKSAIQKYRDSVISACENTKYFRKATGPQEGPFSKAILPNTNTIIVGTSVTNTTTSILANYYAYYGSSTDFVVFNGTLGRGTTNIDKGVSVRGIYFWINDSHVSIDYTVYTAK